LSEIDVNDKGIYDLLNNGYVTCVFQFDGTAAAYLPKVQPENINEISDLTSILRPGPMSMGMVEQYVNAKFNGEKFTYELSDQKLLEKVWDICNISYGLLIYQEQVIKCFTEIAGFNEIEGDNARRAMGKKKPEEMAALKTKFVEGGVKNGYDEDDLSILFHQVEGFSGYGFNLSHAVCYSYITCYTAYLSHYYPLEFYTAALTIDAGNTDDVRRYIKAIKDRGFTLSAPNINKSQDSFIVDGNSIIFGLNAIKGVGANVSKKVIKNRPKSGYKSLGHFVERNKDLINSKVLESYAKAGVFSDFGNKESILQSIRDMLDYNSIIKDIKTYTIFDLCKIDYSEFINNCILKRINVEDSMSYEIDALGLYIKKHPMEDYILDPHKCIEISDLKKYDDGMTVITVGALSCIEVRKTKAKLNMASFNLDSCESSIECICFPKTYSKIMDLLQEGKVVVISHAFVKVENNERVLIVNDITDNLKGYAYKKMKKKETEEFIINSRLKFILRKLENK